MPKHDCQIERLCDGFWIFVPGTRSLQSYCEGYMDALRNTLGETKGYRMVRVLSSAFKDLETEVIETSEKDNTLHRGVTQRAEFSKIKKEQVNGGKDSRKDKVSGK